MFDSGFELSQALIIYIICIHIVAMIVTNMFTSNDFSLISLFLAPIVAGTAIYTLVNMVESMGIPGFYLRILAFLAYGVVLFFVLGFDSNRHNSNMISLAFVSLIITIILHGVANETGLFKTFLISIQSTLGSL